MNDLMKLAGQLALCYAAIYVIASALGQKPAAAPGTAGPRNLNVRGGTNAYRGVYSQFGSCRAQRYYNPDLTAPDATTDQSPLGTVLL